MNYSIKAQYNTFQPKIKRYTYFLQNYSLNGEQWRLIPNTNYNYYVSSFGRVLSLCKNGIRILHQYDNKGYRIVKLSVNGNVYNRRVHRLVAQCFLNLKGNQYVHHKDRNRNNNNITNLTCMTLEQHNKIHRKER